MNRSIKYFNNLALQGKVVSKASRVQAALSILLKGFDRTYDANKLIFVPGYEASGKQCAYDIESELKPVARLLIKSLLELMNHIRNKTHPEIHPIYNEKLFNEMADISKWKNVNIKRNAFKSAMKPNNVVKKKYGYSDETLRKITLLNQSSRCALQLFFMWTGMNDTVLKSMKRSDIYIKSIGANSYIFEGVKGRANYKKIDHSLGFSKYAKKLIEDWLEISKEHFELTGIKDIDNQPFIPYIDSNLHIKYFTHHSTSPQGINKLIEKLFPFRLNATRFRKTKSDILMRATEDIYLVSQGLKNTIDVVTHSYTSGVKADSVRQLSATVESLSLISQGASISESTKNAKVLHSDILSDYNYKQRLKRNEIPVATLAPHGIRCSSNSKFKKLRTSPIENEKKCTDFLSCFDCSNHILVASVLDIWLMLSFYEQVTELKQIPSQNSIPKEKLFKIEIILSRTLDRFKNKSPQEYIKAEQKMEHSDHPLFKGLRGLNDTIEIFNV